MMIGIGVGLAGVIASSGGGGGAPVGDPLSIDYQRVMYVMAKYSQTKLNVISQRVYYVMDS